MGIARGQCFGLYAHKNIQPNDFLTDLNITEHPQGSLARDLWVSLLMDYTF